MATLLNQNKRLREMLSILQQQLEEAEQRNEDLEKLLLFQQNEADRVMVGDGAIDLHAEITALRELGYDRTISLELFNPQLWEQDPLDVLKLGMERLQALLEG